jgi:hypothetical protein
MEFRDLVMTVKDRVAELVGDGASLDAVMAANPTREFNGKWGDPERFLTAVFEELTGAE